MHDLFSPLPTPTEMNAWDRAAVKLGIPEFSLMENAAREAVAVLASVAELEGGSILVFMGKGNNGGDGAAMARHLADAGHNVTVCHTAPLESMGGVSAEHTRLALACGVRFIPATLDAGELAGEAALAANRAGIVVDALLGTGLSGQLRDTDLTLVRIINGLGKRALIFSVDIPSGLSGLTGQPSPEAVRARHTVTFQAPKVGLCLPGADAWTGCLHTRPIGIPAVCREQSPASFVLLQPRPASRPQPDPSGHKASNGRVLVVGGSGEYTGAPILSALGALRSGTGMVSVACPAALTSTVRTAWPEIMVRSLGSGSAWQRNMLHALGEYLNADGILVIGPGMGRTDGAAAVVTGLLDLARRTPAVIDADALHVLAQDRTLLARLTERDILTPHPGEAAALLCTDSSAVQADRPSALEALTEATPAAVVLKGAGTLIGQRGKPMALSPHSLPVLSVGGSGDVLSGVCASMLARKVPAHAAACMAVYTHAKAGELLQRTHPRQGVLAREIADALPKAGW